MRFLPPWVVYGTHGLGAEEIAEQARRYAILLRGLRDGRLHADQASLEALSDLNPVVATWAEADRSLAEEAAR